jgi:predicted DNA-binding mobile mystery protein A
LVNDKMRTLKDRARKRLDERLAAVKVASAFAAPPPRGWIRAIRDAIGMSGPQLARRLGVSPQSLDQTERSESNGSIQLSTLRRYAEALESTLVYALVPNTSLEQMVQARARRIALIVLGRVSQTMKLEDQETSNRDLELRIEAYIRDELRDRDLWGDA